jgi:transcriptional regulator NrdR family protein
MPKYHFILGIQCDCGARTFVKRCVSIAGGVKRRRVCLECKHRMTTLEKFRHNEGLRQRQGTSCQCGGATYVSQVTDIQGAIKRRRICLECGSRFTSDERLKK